MPESPVSGRGQGRSRRRRGRAAPALSPAEHRATPNFTVASPLRGDGETGDRRGSGGRRSASRARPSPAGRPRVKGAIAPEGSGRCGGQVRSPLGHRGTKIEQTSGFGKKLAHAPVRAQNKESARRP